MLHQNIRILNILHQISEYQIFLIKISEYQIFLIKISDIRYSSSKYRISDILHQNIIFPNKVKKQKKGKMPSKLPQELPEHHRDSRYLSMLPYYLCSCLISRGGVGLWCACVEVWNMWRP